MQFHLNFIKRAFDTNIKEIDKNKQVCRPEKIQIDYSEQIEYNKVDNMSKKKDYVIHTLCIVLLYYCKQISSLQCIPVTEKICLNNKIKFENTVSWGYNSTYYPTLSGLNSVSQVSQRFSFLYPLIKTECSKHILQFSCSIHQSACSKVGVLLPCKELCEKVYEDCYVIASSFGIKWPDHMIQCRY